MSASVPWYRTLAWRFFFRTTLLIAALVAVVMAVARFQGRRQAMEGAQAGILASSRIMESNFENQARVMEAGLEVFTTYHQNMVGIEQQDFTSVRDSLLRNLASLKSDVAMVIRPSGALLSCTTDGFKQDYTDVGIVERAMREDEATPATTFRGFFHIDGGTYRGHYLGVARRLLGQDGAFLGVMVVANRLNDRTAVLLRDASLVKIHPSDPASNLGLVSGGSLLGSTLLGRGRNEVEAWLHGPAGSEALASAMASGQSEPIRLTLGGQDQLGMLVRMKGLGAESLKMAELIVIPLDPFQRPFLHLQHTILAVGLGTLVLALLVALTMARRITAPLQHLTRVVGELADGHRPDLSGAVAEDEVGALTKGFQSLLKELEAKEELVADLDRLRRESSTSGISGIPEGAMGDEITTGTNSVVEVETGPMHGRRTTGSSRVQVGDVVAGRYHVDRLLAMGGMGLVLKAHDAELEDEVALKVIRPELASDPVFLAQLKQEIRMARRITHRYVLRTHDYGESNGLAFVTMEYLKGVTLRQLLDDRQRLPMPTVLRIGRQIAEGLQAAHTENVVHRDIKPSNVMFDGRGDVKLMDFGLAAPVNGRGTNADGQIFGTPGYMAPEQVLGEEVDPRTDLYALGVVLFELATGQRPFQSEDRIALLRLHLEQDPPDPRQFNPMVPSGFALLVRAMLARSKAARPASAQEVFALLQQLGEQMGSAKA